MTLNCHYTLFVEIWSHSEANYSESTAVRSILPASKYSYGNLVFGDMKLMGNIRIGILGIKGVK